MSLVAVAAVKRKILMAAMRVELLAIPFEAPCTSHDLVHVVAAAACAELFTCKVLATSKHLARFVHGEVIGRPFNGLSHLFVDMGLVTAQAVLALLLMNNSQHTLVVAVESLDVVIHGHVANCIAEAGLLVPDPESSSQNDDNAHHADGDSTTVVLTVPSVLADASGRASTVSFSAIIPLPSFRNTALTMAKYALHARTNLVPPWGDFDISAGQALI